MTEEQAKILDRLFKALEQPNAEVFESIIASVENKEDILPNARGSGEYEGLILLQYASLFGRKDAVSILLNQLNADPTVLDDDGLSALHVAAKGGNEASNEIMELILDSGVDPDLWNGEQSKTPLHQAAESGQLEICQTLIRQPPYSTNSKRTRAANLRMRDGRGRTAAAIASEYGYEELSKYIFEEMEKAKDDNPPERKKTDYSILHKAAERGKTQVVMKYLERYPDEINTKNPNGLTALHLAAMCGEDDQKKLVEYLLDHGADDTILDDQKKENVLHFAAIGGDEETCQLLLLRNPSLIYLRSSDGFDALHSAICYKRTKIAKLLIEYNADVGSSIDSDSARTDKGHNYPLHYAARFGMTEVVKLLLERGALVSPRNLEGVTPFLVASNYYHLGVVKLLIEANANVQDTDNCGQNALHLIASKLSGTRPQEGLAFMKYLLEEAKVDPFAQNKDGETPLHAATKQKSVPMIELLLSNAGAALANVRDELYHTALHLVFMNRESWLDSDAAIVSALLKGGADPNSTDDQGWTPLHLAGLSPFACPRSMLEELLKSPIIDINAKDFTNEGNTALHYFAQNGHIEAVKLLIQEGANFRKKNKLMKAPGDVTVNSKLVALFNKLKKGYTLQQIEAEEKTLATNSNDTSHQPQLQV